MSDNYFAAKYGAVQNQEENADLEGNQTSANYFSQKYGNPKQAADQQEQIQQAQQDPGYKSGSFMAGVEAFNRQFGRMAEGIVKLGADVVGAEGLSQRVTNLHNKLEQSNLEASEAHPVANVVGGTLGAIGSGVAYGGPSVGAAKTVVGRMLAGGGIGATQGYLTYGDTQEDRLMGAGIGGLLGASAVGLLEAGRSIVSRLRPASSMQGTAATTLTPQKAAAQDAAERIASGYKTTGEAIQAVDDVASSMQKSGINLTPGEAFPKTQGIAEAGLKLSELDKVKNINPKYFQEQANAKQQLHTIIKNMAPDDAYMQEQALYKTLDNVKTDTIPGLVKSNKVIADKYNALLQAEAPSIKSLPKDSLGFLQKLKAEVAEELNQESVTKAGVTFKAGLSPTKKADLKYAKSLIDDVLTNSPEYQAANQMSILRQTRQTYTNLLTRKADQGDMTLKHIQQALFNTEDARKQFIKDVVKVGGDADQAKAVIDGISALSNTPLKKLVTQNIAAQQGMPTSIGDAVSKLFTSRTTSAYNKAVLNLALDPNWADTITKVLKSGVSKTEKVGFLAQTISDVANGFMEGLPVGLGRAGASALTPPSDQQY